jgi:hypothetical protein
MKKLVGFLAIWFLFAGMFWLSFLRRAPASTGEWLLLILAGPPAFLLANLLAEGVGEAYKRVPGIRHLHSFAERRTVGQEISGLRILVYLSTTLLAIALVVVAAWLWQRR